MVLSVYPCVMGTKRRDESKVSWTAAKFITVIYSKQTLTANGSYGEVCLPSCGDEM